ncbi:MAG: PKD domain-containing protein, partial [Bacteroidetes bacterium]
IYSIQPDFNISDTLICLPASVTFSDNSTADTTLVDWQWNFGDGQTASGRNVTHTFTSVPPQGGFEVTLALEDAFGCPQNDTAFIRVYEPLSDIVTNPVDRGICTGESITFSGTPFSDGGSFLDFSWEFSNGPGSEDEVVTRSFPEAGLFTVRMDYVEVASGCRGSQTTTINVQDFPTASFTTDIDGVDLICSPATITFTSTSESSTPLDYRWDFDNGGAVVRGPNPTITLEKGTYEVTLTATTTNGCSDEAVRSFEVIGPTGDFFFPTDPICRGDMVTFTLQDTSEVGSWTWDFGDGNTLDNVNPVTHTYADLPPAEVVPVTLILRTAEGECEFSITRDLPIRNVRADFEITAAGDTTLCAGTYPLINNSVGAENYLWTLPNGETSTDFAPTVTFEPGTYTITLFVENTDEMCVDEETKTFTFFALPEVEAMAEAACIGDTTQLSVIGAEPGWAVNWSPLTPLIDPPTTANPRAILDGDTEFTIILRTEEGCETADTIIAPVIEPFPWDDIEETLCPGDAINVDIPILNPPYIVNWSPFPPPDTIGVEDLDLSVTITDSLGCYSDEYRFFISSVSDSLLVPNFFSPNGDMVNDEFRLFTEMDPRDPDQMIIESFKVFNRWGQLVYQGSGPDARWDGQYNGKPAPSDVYIYQIVVNITKSGRKADLQGQVTLAR